jgi:hypothetical protein
LHKLKLLPATIVSSTLSRSANQLESYNCLNEEEAKPFCTSNSNNLSVSTYSYFDRNLNFEQWMKHKYKEQLPKLSQPVSTPQEKLMSTIIISSHKIKLMNQFESSLSFLITQIWRMMQFFIYPRVYPTTHCIKRAISQ